MQTELESYLNPEHVIAEKGDEIDGLIICLICQGILIDPVECKTCQRSFCKMCTEMWASKGKKCPNQCPCPIYTTSHLVIRHQLEKLKFRCKNGNCNEILTYNDKLSREHESKCYIIMDSVIMQLKENKNFTIFCNFCNSKVSITDFAEHESTCRTLKAPRSHPLYMISKCELCNATSNNTVYVRCKKCSKSFCEGNCSVVCSNCYEIFCRLSCSNSCICHMTNFCQNCFEVVNIATLQCEICQKTENLKCENCREKFICKGCNKIICSSCLITCGECKKNFCLSCVWICSECCEYRCNCKAKINSYAFSVYNFVEVIYRYLYSDSVKEWSTIIKIVYLFAIFVFVLPILFIIWILYIIFAFLCLECLSCMCEKCKDKFTEDDN